VYRGQVCGDVVPPKTRAHRIVVETRAQYYPTRPKANRFYRKRRLKVTDDPGGRGREVATELVTCPACFRASEEPIEHAPLARIRSPPYRAVA
jgi:hypothetical protein